MSPLLIAVLALLGAVVLNLVIQVTRWLVRLPRFARWAWTHSRPRSLGSPSRLPPAWLRDAVARATVWYGDRPLRVYPFEGGGDIHGKKVDPAAVSAFLRSAMTRIGSTRRSGVDAMSAPISASSAVDAIAEGLKSAPSGGDVAAAVVRLFWLIFARGELQMRGHVLDSRAKGPGLALTISAASGRVIERLTVWAREFEPMAGPYSALDDGSRADGLLPVAIAGAVWAHFTILANVWHLDEEQFVSLLRTAEWRSYAFLQVGIECEAVRGADVARTLYARAVDADPGNRVAQFNLASMELLDDVIAGARAAGIARLQRIRKQMEPKNGAHVPRSRRKRNTQRLREARLLQCDPLCYQLTYKLTSAKLNEDVRVEADDAAPVQEWPATDERKLIRKDFEKLDKRVRDLELTLALLIDRETGWPFASSSSWAKRRSLLFAIEGPMRVLWAIVLLRTGRQGQAPWTKCQVDGLPYAPATGPVAARRSLVDSMRTNRLTPGQAIGFVHGPHVSGTSRTGYNLACWYADINELPEALRELQLSLEYGGASARVRLNDPQLRRLWVEYDDEMSTLAKRYKISKPLHLQGDDRSQAAASTWQRRRRRPGPIRRPAGELPR